MISKLTKKRWQEFYKVAYGISKIEIDEYHVTGIAGMMKYESWVNRGRIYTQFILANDVIRSAFFNIETFEYDWEFTEKFYEEE